jgi:hypothetical protein
VETVGGTSCLRLVLALNFRSAQPVPQIAGGAADRLSQASWDTNVRMEVAQLLPVDPRLPQMRQEEAGEIEAKASIRSGNSNASWQCHLTERKTVEIRCD